MCMCVNWLGSNENAFSRNISEWIYGAGTSLVGRWQSAQFENLDNCFWFATPISESISETFWRTKESNYVLGFDNGWFWMYFHHMHVPTMIRLVYWREITFNGTNHVSLATGLSKGYWYGLRLPPSPGPGCFQVWIRGGIAWWNLESVFKWKHIQK